VLTANVPTVRQAGNLWSYTITHFNQGEEVEDE
jgi:hypothetical protein